MIPISYGYRNLLVRWKTTLMTAGGFTLVVAAMIIMLAFVNGICTVCNDSGDPRNVIVLSKGNTDEVLSRLDMRTVLEVEATRGLSRDAGGRISASREVFLVVTQPDKATGVYKNIQVRGVLPQAFDVHREVRIVAGRRPRPGQGEVLVGQRIQQELGVSLGSLQRIGHKAWRVVGIFEAKGSMFESEFWLDVGELLAHFHRDPVYNSVVLRAQTPRIAEQVAERLRTSRRIAVEAQTEKIHYAKQAEQTETIRTSGMVIAAFMAIGAVFGVTNTMFAAISQRIKDIAVMRVLGFRRQQIMLSFLIEAILIAAIGVVLGTAVGYCVNGITLSCAMGAKSVAFAFTVDAPTVLAVGLFALVMGVLGGLLPALSVMRVEPLESLR
jgi:ABC-type lipoprotein release transport system permease subunit